MDNKEQNQDEGNLNKPLHSSSIITFAEKNDFNFDFLSIQDKLKTKPTLIQCPFCKNENETKIESNISCCSITFYISGLIIIPILIQAIRKKGNSISIVKHFCGSCNNLLYVYKPVC